MPNYEKITTLQNEIQAAALESELKTRDIPHFIRSYHDTVYNGIYQQTKGWGIVEAPIEFKKDILEILNDLEK